MLLPLFSYICAIPDRIWLIPRTHLPLGGRGIRDDDDDGLLDSLGWNNRHESGNCIKRCISHLFIYFNKFRSIWCGFIHLGLNLGQVTLLDVLVFIVVMVSTWFLWGVIKSLFVFIKNPIYFFKLYLCINSLWKYLV